MRHRLRLGFTTTWRHSTAWRQQIKVCASTVGLDQHAAREREAGAALGEEARGGLGTVFIRYRQG
jgi:hypothetical protein